MLNYLLGQNEVDAAQVDVQWHASTDEVVALMASGEATVCMLPVPAATTVLIQNDKVRTALDLTEEWKDAEAEAAAFAAEMQNALDALDGARETGSKLSAALKAAAAEVDKIRAECNGFGDLGLVQNWLDGDQRRFDALGKTGQPGGKS